MIHRSSFILHPSLRPWGGPERGAAAIEIALTLPVVLSLIIGTLAITGWYYSQSAAAVSTAAAARAGGLSRGDLGRAQQQNESVLIGLIGDLAGAYLAGETQVSADPLRRAVIVRVRSAPSVRVPFLGAVRLPVFGGSFGRNWQFWSGPPGPWE